MENFAHAHPHIVYSVCVPSRYAFCSGCVWLRISPKSWRMKRGTSRAFLSGGEISGAAIWWPPSSDDRSLPLLLWMLSNCCTEAHKKVNLECVVEKTLKVVLTERYFLYLLQLWPLSPGYHFLTEFVDLILLIWRDSHGNHLCVLFNHLTKISIK
jgi:hypothetical protein